MQYILC